MRYIYGSENLRQQINANQYDPSKDSLKDENHDGIADDTAGDVYSDDGVGYRYAYYDDGTKQTETTPDGSVFQYNQDGNVTSEQYAGGATDATVYNEDGTVGSVSNANGYNLSYQYNDSGNVSDYDLKFGAAETDFGYTYDENGNIETIRKSANLQETHYYDDNSQLVRDDSATQNETIVYAYDINGNGNLTSKTVYPYTTASKLSSVTPTHTYNYKYGDSADSDRLESYDGDMISYDTDGNATGYDGWTYTWENGHLPAYKELRTAIQDFRKGI